VDDDSGGRCPGRKPTMRKKYFCEEDVFGYVWENADADGIWDGNDATLAAEFGVSADAAYAVLSALCDGHHLQRLESAKYIIVRWRERDDAGEEDQPEAHR